MTPENPKDLQDDFLQAAASKREAIAGEVSVPDSDPAAAAALVLDPAQIEILRNEAPGLLEQLVVLFIDIAEKTIAEMTATIATGDARATGEGAHLLKGSACNFGAQRLVAVAQELEQTARRGETDGLEKLLDALRAEYQLLKEALRIHGHFQGSPQL